MTKEELLTKLYIEALSQDEQNMYLANLYEVAAKRAGYRISSELAEEKLKQAEDSLNAGMTTDEVFKKLVSDQKQVNVLVEEFNRLVEQISADTKKQLKKLQK